MLTKILTILSAALKVFEKFFQARHDNRIREATRVEIENEARENSRRKNNQLRDTLNYPIDVDSLPDSFFQSTESDTGDGAK